MKNESNLKPIILLISIVTLIFFGLWAVNIFPINFVENGLQGPNEVEEVIDRPVNNNNNNENNIAIASTPSLIDNPKDYLPPDTNYSQIPSPSPVYSSIEDVQAGNAFTTHGGKDVWVNVIRSEVVDNQRYYYIGWSWNIYGWISADDLSFTPFLSNLRGIDLRNYPGEHLAMVFVDVLNVRSEPGGLTEETIIGQINKYHYVTVEEERFVEGRGWYRIGNQQWISADYVRNLTPGTRPEGVGPNEKWIEINLTEQTVFAHEGDTPVFGSLTSTGTPGRETITGLYLPWSRSQTSPMRGYDFGLFYDFADVPWIVYFHGAYAYHGVYWHDNYGTVQSAGCINLSPHDAHWIFNWGDYNTWTYIHY